MARRALTALALALAAGGCGSDGGPTGAADVPTPVPAPTSTADGPFTLAGIARSAASRGPVASLRVEVTTGPDTGRSTTTDALGAYRLAGLAGPGFSVRASGGPWETTEATASTASLDLVVRRRSCAAAVCGDRPAECNEAMPLLQPPYEGTFRAVSQFDHSRPMAGFRGTNDGRFVHWCASNGSYDGHNGWDYLMPEGTPILAVAAGTVRAARSETTFFCPFLGRDVAGLFVQVTHRSPYGESIISEYLHLSELRVAAGQTVAAGQVVGLSGNTGCSTAPHLHFAVYREPPGGGTRLVPTDPYGWQGTGVDPWSADPEGAPSVWLWQGAPPRVTGEAPPVFELHNIGR